MHVLTTHGISTITVPDELPGLLRDFTKDVIRAQPEDLLHFAAEYFSALAGVGTVSSQQVVDSAAAAAAAAASAAPTVAPAAPPSPIAAPPAAAAQRQAVSNGVVEATGWRRNGTVVPDQQPSDTRHLHEIDAAAPAAFQQEAAALEAPPQRDADGTDADTDDHFTSLDNPPSAAWEVDRGGDVVPSLPLVSQLYAAGRTSDHQPSAARRSRAEPPAAQLPAGSTGNANASPTTSPAPLVQQDEGVAALADVDAPSLSPKASVGPASAGDPAPEGDAVPVVNEEDAALVALAERLFKEADANASGGLDRKEFRNVMRSIELGLSTAQVRALMAEADEDEDGFVDWAEFLPTFLPLLRTVQAAQQLAAEQEADLRSRATAMLQADMPQEALESLMRDVFRSADTDGSGALSRKEFKACLQSDMATELKLSRQDINTLLTEVDADGNGLVDYEEFIPVAFNILVERLKASLLAAEAAGTAAS